MCRAKLDVERRPVVVMKGRIEAGHGGLRAGRWSARDWRIRFSSDLAGRLAELDEDEPWYGYDDYDYDYDDDDRRWCYDEDPRASQFGVLLPELRARILAAPPFNPIPLVEPRVHGGEPLRRAAAPIEQRLVDHYDRLGRGSVEPCLIGEAIEDELAQLDAIASNHFGGWIDPMLALILVRPFWIRDLANWRAPAPASRERVHASLVEHLLIEFAAPRFLARASFGTPSSVELRWLMWLIVLGQGGSLRRLLELAHARWPAEWRPQPNKLVAALARVPDSSATARGIMLAEILRLGGSSLELRWVEQSRFTLDPSAVTLEDDELEFWRSSVSWLVRHREQLDDASAVDILDWARHCHTERQREGGRFEWRGRTVASARREAATYADSSRYWHRGLRWHHHGWDWAGEFGGLAWSIRELHSSEALMAESLAMSHCVRDYDLACWAWRSAIFSLMQEGRRCATIEIDLARKRVVQIKRAFNQAPSELERSVIEHWRSTVVDPSA